MVLERIEGGQSGRRRELEAEGVGSGGSWRRRELEAEGVGGGGSCRRRELQAEGVGGGGSCRWTEFEVVNVHEQTTLIACILTIAAVFLLFICGGTNREGDMRA